mgnify:CR=1 FL=1
MLFALVVGAYGGYRLRVRSVEVRSRELEQLVEERTAELSRANLLLQGEIVERQRAEGALAQHAAKAAVAEERNRLARELHDSVTQSLYSITLFAEAGRRTALALPETLLAMNDRSWNPVEDPPRMRLPRE